MDIYGLYNKQPLHCWSSMTWQGFSVELRGNEKKIFWVYFLERSLVIKNSLWGICPSTVDERLKICPVMHNHYVNNVLARSQSGDTHMIIYIYCLCYPIDVQKWTKVSIAISIYWLFINFFEVSESGGNLVWDLFMQQENGQPSSS